MALDLHKRRASVHIRDLWSFDTVQIMDLRTMHNLPKFLYLDAGDGLHTLSNHTALATQRAQAHFN